MRVQKCYIAQRRTGEIVPARQVNMAESEEWRCHHCQCPLIFHLPTRTSPSWFEHDIPRGQPEVLLQCPWLAPASGKSSTIEKLQQLVAQLPPIITTTQWQCTMCGLTYGGEKRSPQCRKGIYSREIRI